MAAVLSLSHESARVNPDTLIDPLRETHRHFVFRANNPDQVCYERYENIAACLGISLSQFYRRLSDLVTLGAVVVHKRKKMRPVIQPLFYATPKREKRESDAKNSRVHIKRESEPESCLYTKTQQDTPPQAEDAYAIPIADTTLAAETTFQTVASEDAQGGILCTEKGDERHDRQRVRGFSDRPIGEGGESREAAERYEGVSERNRREVETVSRNAIPPGTGTLGSPAHEGRTQRRDNRAVAESVHPGSSAEIAVNRTTLACDAPKPSGGTFRQGGDYEHRFSESEASQSREAVAGSVRGITASEGGTGGSRERADDPTRLPQRDSRHYRHRGRDSGTQSLIAEDTHQRLIDTYGAARVQHAETYVKQQQARGKTIRNPAGFITDALTKGWNMKLCDRTPAAIERRHKAVLSCHLTAPENRERPDADLTGREAFFAAIRERKAASMGGGVGV